MQKIENFEDLENFCSKLTPHEKKMPVQVGLATEVRRVNSIGHCTDAPDLGENTLIIEAI